MSRIPLGPVLSDLSKRFWSNPQGRVPTMLVWGTSGRETTTQKKKKKKEKRFWVSAKRDTG